MQRLIALISTVFFIYCSLSTQAEIDRYSVVLRAHPQAIVADSYSSTTITAEVFDSLGRSAPDGTLVEFTSNLGIIERNARSEAGVARVRLQSGNTMGTAIVSAVVTSKAAVAKMDVDFLEPGTELFDESFISVESDRHLGYCVDSSLVDAAGGVRIYTRGLTIEAEQAQIDLKTNILRAVGKMGGDAISITRGEKKMMASALYLNLNNLSGVMFTPADDGAKRMLIRGADFFITPDTDPKEGIKFEFSPVSAGDLFIVARSLLIKPGEEVKIKRATFYMDGEKLLSVPLHVVPLGNRTAGIDRMLTYGTAGLRLDLPLYYSLSAHGTGALRIKHSEPTQWGYSSGVSGWQADIEQDYNYGASTDGTFTLNRITSRDWGARWHHRTELNDNSQVYAFFDYPSHKNIYGNLDYRKSFKDFVLSTSLRGSMLQNADDRYSSSLYLQSNPKTIFGNAVTYALTSRLSYTSQNASSQKVGTGLGLQFYGKPLQFGRSSSLNTSLTIGQDWGGGNTGASVFGNAGYYLGLGRIGQFGLNYSYSWANSAGAFNSQRLSADFYVRPSDKWDTRLYVTRGLSDQSTSAFGELNYSILPTWRLGALGTYQNFNSGQKFAYTDLELALSKLISGQQARLIWSKSINRFRLEFSTLKF
ncbi:MAG: Ig-like domain-containing protein [Armatimonadetes bacterium]|nr:Ig-like domain-containing protein [Armatimonadota bacterium]